MIAVVDFYAACFRISTNFEAAGLLSAGFELDPRFPSFSINYLHVHRQWVDTLCRAGHFDKALVVLARAARERPNEPWFAKAIADVHRRQSEKR